MLVGALVNMVMTVYFTTLLVRIYVQLTGSGRESVSSDCRSGVSTRHYAWPSNGTCGAASRGSRPVRRGSGKLSKARPQAREAGAQISGQGGRMVERAGVDADALARPARQARSQRLGEQPAAMALAGQLRDEAEEADQAFAGGRGSRARSGPLRSPAGSSTAWTSATLRQQRRIVHRQPREPQPVRADPAEQRAVAVRIDRGPALQPQRRFGDRRRCAAARSSRER